MEIMYKAMPSGLKIGFWCVAKKQFDIKRNELKFVPNEGVHFANEKDAQAHADLLNKENEEDEQLFQSEEGGEQ